MFGHNAGRIQRAQELLHIAAGGGIMNSTDLGEPSGLVRKAPHRVSPAHSGMMPKAVLAVPAHSAGLEWRIAAMPDEASALALALCAQALPVEPARPRRASESAHGFQPGLPAPEGQTKLTVRRPRRRLGMAESLC